MEIKQSVVVVVVWSWGGGVGGRGMKMAVVLFRGDHQWKGTVRGAWAVYSKYLFYCFLGSYSIRFKNQCLIRNKHKTPMVIN